MSDEKKSLDYILKNISKNKAEILESFTESYIAETGLKPSEIMCVEQRFDDRVEWRFVKQSDIKSDRNAIFLSELEKRWPSKPQYEMWFIQTRQKGLSVAPDKFINWLLTKLKQGDGFR